MSYWRTFRCIPINDDDSRETNIYINTFQDKTIYSILSGKITTCAMIGEKIVTNICK